MHISLILGQLVVLGTFGRETTTTGPLRAHSPTMRWQRHKRRRRSTRCRCCLVALHVLHELLALGTCPIRSFIYVVSSTRPTDQSRFEDNRLLPYTDSTLQRRIHLFFLSGVFFREEARWQSVITTCYGIRTDGDHFVSWCLRQARPVPVTSSIGPRTPVYRAEARECTPIPESFIYPRR